MSHNKTSKPFPFLRLPLELREAIYSYYFKPADRLVRNHKLEVQGFVGGLYQFDFDICLVNRQLNREAGTVWRRENIFVKIGTPWPSAVNHISSEGLVPMVCTDSRADNFIAHHALVQITAPFHQAVPEHAVILLLEDLHLFAQTWYYSALSYPMLNDRLSTTFVLRDPYRNDDQAPSKKMSLALQRQILLPFVMIKGLYSKQISGFDPDVSAELERGMAEPVPTLSESCEAATDLIAQGDQILACGRPEEALQLYTDSFRAIHILVQGRTRRILADGFFHDPITTGRYRGNSGTAVRVVLRLKLVARFVLCYLKMENWGEAAYWGMRSIRIMRETMDIEFEDFIGEFAGGVDLGMIYVRTGLAFWKMENDYKLCVAARTRSQWTSELASYVNDNFKGSEMIWSVAGKYLQARETAAVRKELAQFGAPKDCIALKDDTGLGDPVLGAQN